MEKAIVTRVVQTTITLANGTIQAAYNVSFMIGKHGPFSIQVPAAQFQPSYVTQQLDEFAATINALPQGS
jgi:hypothetical protein